MAAGGVIDVIYGYYGYANALFCVPIMMSLFAPTLARLKLTFMQLKSLIVELKGSLPDK